MAGLIRRVQKPPFDKVGVFDLETFFPAKERLQLAMAAQQPARLARASPPGWRASRSTCSACCTPPKASRASPIISIAHLSDAERMFFVTLLLNEVIAWMRSQSGTASPARHPLHGRDLRLLPADRESAVEAADAHAAQAGARVRPGRACWRRRTRSISTTRGWRTAGTWFLGRLQTERDKLRVLEGLKSALAGRETARTRRVDLEPDAARVPDAQRARRRAGAD